MHIFMLNYIFILVEMCPCKTIQAEFGLKKAWAPELDTPSSDYYKELKQHLSEVRKQHPFL